MRPKLLKPRRERSHERPARRSHGHPATPRRAEPRVIVMEAEPSITAGPTAGCDLDAERVRRAGGPLDVAVYTCSLRLPLQRPRLDDGRLPALRDRPGLVVLR